MALREFRPPSRRSGFRDSKLIVIATEDTKAAPKYFQDMASPAFFYNPKIHVQVLDRVTTASAPTEILRQLDDFKRAYKLNKNDELWIVVDVDNWREKLSDIARLCRQKNNYFLAISNPCFELWLLLHIKSLENYTSEELNELVKNKKVNKTRSRLETELIKLLGAYNKSNLNSSQYLPHVHLAIERAKRLDTNPDHRWPNGPGSHIYKLAEKIIVR